MFELCQRRIILEYILRIRVILLAWEDFICNVIVFKYIITLKIKHNSKPQLHTLDYINVFSVQTFPYLPFCLVLPFLSFLTCLAWASKNVRDTSRRIQVYLKAILPWKNVEKMFMYLVIIPLINYITTDDHKTK